MRSNKTKRRKDKRKRCARCKKNRLRNTGSGRSKKRCTGDPLRLKKALDESNEH